ncbi:MAG: hypothetical protein EWM72_00155 [Nitrospira sp.]|nr:MAG: hypothetical protein EWM72_00155 [Nitrospira sp.]
MASVPSAGRQNESVFCEWLRRKHIIWSDRPSIWCQGLRGIDLMRKRFTETTGWTGVSVALVAAVFYLKTNRELSEAD